jgi:hypothetical protein
MDYAKFISLPYKERIQVPIEKRIEFSRMEQKQKMEIELAERKKVKKYCNEKLYTDIVPFEVVRVVSDQTVEIRAMDYKQIKAPKNFSPGGFLGHFHDNRSGQEYEYTSNPENPIIRIRWSKRGFWAKGKYRRFRMSDKPERFYDYNF